MAILILSPLAVDGATGTEGELTSCDAGQTAKQAIEGCTKILSLPGIDSSTRANAFLIRGNAYSSISQLALASADYESAQKITYSPNVAFALAAIDLNTGKNREAIDELSKLIDAGIATAQVFNLRGAAFQNLGEFDASIADFNKALILDPKFLMALNNRATAYAKKGDYEAAVKDIDSVLATDPDMPMALVNRCGLLARDGKFDLGRISCDKAEHLGSDNYFILLGIGGAYYDAARYEDAIGYYNRSLRLQPNNAMALYSRGMANSKLGKDEESKADLLEAERIEPDIATLMAKTGMK